MTDVTGLDELRAMPPGPERVAAVQAWLARLDKLADEARTLRNSDVRLLCLERLPGGRRRGPAETARLLGMPLGSVKAAKARGTE